MKAPVLSDVTQAAIKAGKMVYNDGGRSKYFKGSTGDCVTRAIAIATGIDYKEVYDAMHAGIKDLIENGRTKYAKDLRKRPKGKRGTTPRKGVNRAVYQKYLESKGWTWCPTMSKGSGCLIHLNPMELPDKGIIICRVSKHLVTMINGVIHDTYDCTRDGNRCVYGIFIKDNTKKVKKKK